MIMCVIEVCLTFIRCCDRLITAKRRKGETDRLKHGRTEKRSQKHTVGPRCLIVNEVGEVFVASEGKEGKSILLNLLTSASPSDRTIAFCWLSKVPALTEELSEVLATFRKTPQNEELLEEADEMIAKSAI